MTRFPDKVREKKQAEEDRYFTRRNRELRAARKAKENRDRLTEARPLGTALRNSNVYTCTMIPLKGGVEVESETVLYRIGK